jgi:hypothetical protein
MDKLEKQLYTKKEYENKIDLINKNKNLIHKKYILCKINGDKICKIMDIMDYIDENYVQDNYGDIYWMFACLYNNIFITINYDDPEYSLIFQYIESEINTNDLKLLKDNIFLFLFQE